MSLKRKLQFRPLRRFVHDWDRAERYEEPIRAHPAIRCLPRAKRRRELRRYASLGIKTFLSIRYLKAGRVVAYHHMS